MQATETLQDFTVHKFRSYSGPNYYLNRQSFVFNLFLDPNGPTVDFYREAVTTKLPKLKKRYPKDVITLFVSILINIYKMDIDLFVGKYSISSDGDEWVIALEHIDDYISMEIIYFVKNWLTSINRKDQYFDFEKEFNNLQDIVHNSIMGAPTVYSMIENAVKNQINVHYLNEENQFQWGYGKKQIRGNSTIFHIDSKTDIDLISCKDYIYNFLKMYGFPTPSSSNTFYEVEIIEEAERIGYPVVIKPVKDKKRKHLFCNISTKSEVKKAFNNILTASEKINKFDGVIVQKQIPGFDYRILLIGGKFAACMQRIQPFIIGDNEKTIKELIAIENDKEERKDLIRSPLRKIAINKTLIDHLKKNNLTLDSKPKKGEKITLGDTAHISKGGISINTTNQVHPDNIKLMENVAKFFNITVLGIDLISEDISKSWRSSNLAIIDLNAGPGIFMHLFPGIGQKIDIPDIIMKHFFKGKTGSDRIPIIAGNCLSQKLIEMISHKMKEYQKNCEIGSIRENEIYIDDNYFTKKERHDDNCRILLRNPKLDLAIINHSHNDIEKYGIWHQGLDLAILENASYTEYILKRDLIHNGLLLEILDIDDAKQELLLTCNEKELKKIIISNPAKKDDKIFNILKPYLKKILFKYE